MSQVIYEWSGDYFCTDDLIYAMVEHRPWAEWAGDRELSELDTDTALHMMAVHFNINEHSTAARKAANFPTKVLVPTETIFCAVCLTLLNDQVR